VPEQSRKDQKRAEAEARNRIYALRKPLETRLKSMEKELAKLTEQKRRLEMVLAAPDLYDESQRDLLKKHLQEQSRIGVALAKTEEGWLMASTELEALLANSVAD
jgi:ATP-binding cassette subfamily F protein 3